MLQTNNVANETNNLSEKITCIYKGLTYFVITDMNTKECFIEVEGKKLYLDKNGSVANKKRGTRSVKTAIESFEDMKAVQDYFISNKQWNFFLLFTLNINTGRRISDLLNVKWSDFFNKNGNIKKHWTIEAEQKTKKSKDIFINAAIQKAFEIFLENEESISIKHNYSDFIFKQLHGSHRGKVISAEGYRQALIKAQKVLGYEIRSHSMRRGMGSMMLELHPNDPKAKSVLTEIYNHSSEKMTNRYIGEISKLEDSYFADLGEKYLRYIMNGEEIPFIVKKPVSVYDNSELRDYMMCSFGKILDAKDETDPIVLIKLYNELLDGLEDISK